MKHLKNLLLAMAVLLLALVPEASPAQTVTAQPAYIDNNGGVTDFGNGPLEFKIVTGNAIIFASLGSGVGSTAGSSTTLTLTATPTTPPCVGCIISGTGITSGTTVAAFNGTTTITLSAAMTVAASTPLAWGAACPSSAAGVKGAGMSVGQPPGDLPFYTQARICGYSGFGAGASVMSFAIGAH